MAPRYTPRLGLDTAGVRAYETPFQQSFFARTFETRAGLAPGPLRWAIVRGRYHEPSRFPPAPAAAGRFSINRLALPGPGRPGRLHEPERPLAVRRRAGAGPLRRPDGRGGDDGG